MANPVAANILKSKAILYIAPAGEALPDETTIDVDEAWGGNWARVGFTKTPTVLAIEEEQFGIEVQELLNAIDRVAIKQSARFETTLAEVTGEYLALLLGGTPSTTAAGAGQKGYEQLDVVSRFLLTKYIVGLEGSRLVAGVAQPVRFFFPRCTLMVGGELEFSQKTSDYTGLPIQISALDNDAGTAWFQMQRITAAATS